MHEKMKMEFKPYPEALKEVIETFVLSVNGSDEPLERCRRLERLLMLLLLKTELPTALKSSVLDNISWQLRQVDWENGKKGTMKK